MIGGESLVLGKCLGLLFVFKCVMALHKNNFFMLCFIVVNKVGALNLKLNYLLNHKHVTDSFLKEH